MKNAIIAVCSTVIGTVVGWILGKINFGKLHIALSDFSEEFHYTDPLSIHISGKKDHELYSVKLSFKVRLYNSSSISKTIRDCTLEFLVIHTIFFLNVQLRTTIVEYSIHMEQSIRQLKLETYQPMRAAMLIV